MRKGENMTNIVNGNNKYDAQDENKKWKQKLKEAREKFLKDLTEENAELAKLMKLGTQTMAKHLK